MDTRTERGSSGPVQHVNTVTVSPGPTGGSDDTWPQSRKGSVTARCGTPPDAASIRIHDATGYGSLELFDNVTGVLHARVELGSANCGAVTNRSGRPTDTDTGASSHVC